MKIQVIFSALLLLSSALSAQDTIFVRDGQKIPAIIVEKNKEEIKYRKPGPGNAVYSVFISDVLSIHYKDGIIADYTRMGSEDEKKPETALDGAGTRRTIRFSIGGAFEYATPHNWNGMVPFWRHYTSNPVGKIEAAGNSVPFIFKMVSALDGLGRNWFGDDVRLQRVEGVVHASDGSGTNEIKLNEFLTSIMVFYGHTLDHKRNFLVVIEAGVDMSFGLNGKVILGGRNYGDVSSVGLVVPHFAVGPDYSIGKRLLVSARVGYRINRTEKLEYFVSKTDWGYFSGRVASGGVWANIGLCYNFYIKSPFGNPSGK